MTMLVAEVDHGGPIDVDAMADAAGEPVRVGNIVGAFSTGGRLLGVAFVYAGGHIESFVFGRSR